MTIRVSRGRSLLVVLLAAGGVRALALCELPAPAFVLAATVVIALAAHDLYAPRVTSLTLDGDGGWTGRLSDGERFLGRLVSSGYRSGFAVVLVFETDRPDGRTRRRRVAVFADGVDARDFSFLHLQLAFAGTGR